MMILPSSEEAIKTRYGFSIYGSSQASTLIKCFRLVNDYEPSLVTFMLPYLNRETVFVDIGANEGYFTLLAASRGASVYAVEPSRHNLKLLETNITKNNYSSQVTILPYAAGDANTTISFYDSLLNGMWSSVGQGQSNFISTRTQVEMRRLEDIIQCLPDLIKMDVEGFEDSVMKGVLSWLESRGKRPIWVIETDDRTPQGQAVLNLFQEYGYTVTTLIVDSVCLPGRLYSPQPYEGKVGFRNFIFQSN